MGTGFQSEMMKRILEMVIRQCECTYVTELFP